MTSSAACDRPNPLFVRPGQRYAPRRKSAHARTIVIRRSVSDEAWAGIGDH